MAKSDLVRRIDQKRDYGVGAASTVYHLNNSNAFFAELSAITADMGTLNAGSIVIGTANKLWLNDAADGGLAVGGIVKEDAPFRVSETGQLVATDVRITAGNGVEINEDGLRIGGAEASALWGGEIKTAGGVGTGVHGLRWYDIYGVPRVSILTLKPGTNAPYFRLGGPTDPEWLQWDATGLALSGTITALAGNIGGWTIATGLLHAGENTSYVGMQPGVYPFFAGASNPALANFRVNSQGVLYAADAVIAGDITAISGRIEGLLRIGTDAAVNIRLDGYNALLESSNFVAGVSGWRIDASGSAEFENITARGAIRTAVFEKSLVTAFAGSQIVAKSAAVLYEAFVAQSGTVLKVRPQAGAAPFALNDLIHLKDAVGVIWLRCDDNGTLTGTDHYVYAVTKMNGTAVTTYQVGHAAVDYGQSGQGYWIVSADGMLGASAAWALRSHAGEPWSVETTHVYAGTDGKLYAGGGDVVLDNTGISILAGTDATNELKFVSDTGSPLGTLYAGPDSENPSLVLASAHYLYLSAMQTQITSQDGIDFLGPLYINRYTPIYDVTVASSGEPQMLFVDASENKLYLGGSTNGTVVDKGGAITYVGSAKRKLSMRPTLVAPKIVKVGADYYVIPTQIDRGASSGYSLPIYAANDEELFFNEHIAGRWDGASDIVVSVIGYLSAAEDVNDDFALQLSWSNKATSSGVFPDTTTDVEVRTNIDTDRNAAMSIYKIEFTIDWDTNTPDIVASDLFCGRLRRVAVGGGYTEMSGEFVVQAIVITYVVDKVYKAP